MANFSIEVTHDSTENTRIFGNVDSAIEYIRARLNENFTVYFKGDYSYQRVIAESKAKLLRNLNNVQVK